MEASLFFYVFSSFDFFFVYYYSFIFLTAFLRSFFRKTPSNRNQERIHLYRNSESEDTQFFSDEGSEPEDVDEVIQGEALFLPSSGSENDTAYSDEIKCFSSEHFVTRPSSEYSIDKESEDEHEEVFQMENSNDLFHFDWHAEDADACFNFPTEETESQDVLKGFCESEKFKIIDPSEEENPVVHEQERKAAAEEIFVESFADGSTSKSSCEWRSSSHYKDSETDDPFSSSSRKRSSNWETYTIFKKYDEEMMYLDRIASQRLSETESLRSIQIQPGSFSQRIAFKLSTKYKDSVRIYQNSYQQLEVAYVAQICLAWEALNWNYKNFRRSRTSKHDEDTGCSAKIAQELQQFHVLLQRFIENEPYEKGRRPETYARARTSTSKFLQIPEFRGSEVDEKDEDKYPRIPSSVFLRILEEAIQTFMDFLKADKENYFQALKCLTRKKRTRVDPSLVSLVKRENKKKKRRLKDLLRNRKCFRKKRLSEEENTEILMGLIDLKVVSRVLRMPEITEEQLHWCEEKTNKVRVCEGRLQRDSSPLFFTVL